MPSPAAIAPVTTSMTTGAGVLPESFKSGMTPGEVVIVAEVCMRLQREGSLTGRFVAGDIYSSHAVPARDPSTPPFPSGLSESAEHGNALIGIDNNQEGAGRFPCRNSPASRQSLRKGRNDQPSSARFGQLRCSTKETRGRPCAFRAFMSPKTGDGAMHRSKPAGNAGRVFTHHSIEGAMQ